MSRISIITLLLFFVSCGQMNKDYLVIGHRGAMGHETENSLASSGDLPNTRLSIAAAGF